MLGKTLPTRYISSPSCFYNMHNRLVRFWGHLVLKRGEDASLCTRLILCGRWSCSCNRCCLLFKISWLKRERKIISSEETLEIMHRTRISHFFSTQKPFQCLLYDQDGPHLSRMQKTWSLLQAINLGTQCIWNDGLHGIQWQQILLTEGVSSGQLGMSYEGWVWQGLYAGDNVISLVLLTWPLGALSEPV